MTGRAWKWVLLILLLIMVGVLVCQLIRVRVIGDVQPPNVIVFAPLPGATPVTTPRTWTLPASAHHTFTPSGSKPPPATRPPQEKMSSIIQKWIDAGRGGRRERFVVLWDDPIAIERFPDLDPLLSLGAAFNASARMRAIKQADILRGLRRPYYAADTAGYSGKHIKGLESYWLIQAMLMEMTVNQAKEIAARPGVVYVMPDNGGEQPTQCSPGTGNGPFVKDARAAIASDPYFNQDYPAVWMSLLDTGVSSDHALLSGDRAHVASRGDCVDGDCEDEDLEDVHPGGHGTSTAAILSGYNTAWGDEFRGVTGLDLHCYRVYKKSPDGGSSRLIISAAIRGFQQGASELDRVIVAEIQAESGDANPLAKAADHAFATGAVVVAAGGNGSSNVIRSPANARCALGTGAYVLQTGQTDTQQDRGSTYDGRQKPDLQAPTSTCTAGTSANASLSSTMCKEFGSTSGATPYAGAAAALLWGWLKDAIGSETHVDPGQVMATLIASTDMAPGGLGTIEAGAGKLVLPTDGWGWFGRVTIDATGDAVAIPIDLNGHEAKFLDVSLWWPEKLETHDGVREDTHNDIDLYLTKPNGQELKAARAEGVFERKTVAVTAANRKEWTLTIQGYDIKRMHQDVYFFVAARRATGQPEPLDWP